MPRIAIIGSGFGGLGVAVELRRAGFRDLTIYERGATVGGVWRENIYPGAACDIPSPYYSFSYAANTGWPRRYSRQPDILAYLEGIADEYGLREYVRFDTEVASASFDEQTATWTVVTATGDTDEFDVLIPAVGQLSRPAWPRIDGQDDFAGPSFHSAQWDEDVDLVGKRVAVIGTGASAIQFVPEIAPDVAGLMLFQRTPPYILPRPDTEYSRRHQRIFARVPAALLAERGGWWTVSEVLTLAFLYSKLLSAFVRTVSHVHMRRQLRGTRLFRKVWPSYALGCKRILFSNDYLPALARANVELVTADIARITRDGIRTTDGVEHRADTIIYGTGFTASDFLAPMRIVGAGGRELRDQWREGARAYLGITVPNFPNLFLMYGPNTNLGSGSIVFMLECQARYIRQALVHLTRTGRPVAVRPAVEQDYDDATQARLVDGVWSQCANWYRAANGRVAANWPGTLTEYRWRTATFDPAAYEPAAYEPAPLHR